MTAALQYLVTSAVDGPFGSSLTSAHYSDDGARVIRLGNIGDGYWRGSDEAFIPLDYARQLDRHAVVEGDVVVAGLGDVNNPLGRAAVLPDLGQAIVKADCFRLRLDPGRLDARFLVYYMTGRGSAVARERAHGSTRQRLPLGEMLKVRVPVPPLEVQRRIADFLDTETAHIDSLLATNHHAATLVQERLRRRFAHLLSVDTGDLFMRSGRERRKGAPLGLVAVTYSGKTVQNQQSQASEQLVAYLTASNVADAGIVHDTERRMWATRGEIERLQVRKDDVLVIEGGATAGRAVLLSFEPPEATILQNHVHCVRPLAGWDAGYIGCVLRAYYESGWYEHYTNAVTFGSFPTPKLRALVVPEVELDAQRRLAVELAESVADVQGALELLVRQQTLLTERRQALITAAVTGELEV